MLGVSADDKHCVTVDGKVVVGRRLRHRAGVHRRRPHGHTARGSPLWPQWAAAWPPVPYLGSDQRRVRDVGDVRSLFQPYVTQMSIYDSCNKPHTVRFYDSCNIPNKPRWVNGAWWAGGRGNPGPSYCIFLSGLELYLILW